MESAVNLLVALHCEREHPLKLFPAAFANALGECVQVDTVVFFARRQSVMICEFSLASAVVIWSLKGRLTCVSVQWLFAIVVGHGERLK